MDILLSIIVPMYNVEKYIARCLNSIINNKGFSGSCELIVVNDGTKDNSESIARVILSNVPNAFVISQDNRGLSAARNAGLAKAKGRYVWFIDSDDWIKGDSMSILMEYLENGADIIQFGYCLAYDTQESKDFHRTACKSSGKEILIRKNWEAPAQFSLFKRTLLMDNDLHFYVGIYHEDMEFTPRAIWYAQNVIIIDEILYNYYQGNPHSIVSVPNIKKCYDLIFVSKSTINFIDTVVTDNACKSALLNLAALEFNTCLRKISLFDKKEIKSFIANLKEDKTFLKRFRVCTSIKYRLMAWAVSISPYFYIKILSSSKK